jgi:hypothetical protein
VKEGVMRKFLFGSGLVSLTAVALLLAVGCGGDDEGGTTPPPACSIAIYSPTEGQPFTTPAQTPAGDRVDVRWLGEGGGQVRVDLLRGGSLVGVIDDAVDNNAGYTFWVIDDMISGSADDYQVRVSHLTSDGCADTSPEFTIRDLRGCDIELLINYPGMRDDLPARAGDEMSISWVPTATTGSYDVELWQSSVGDVLVGVIAEDLAANELAEDWTIDSFHVGDSWYYVKVQDREIESCFGVSDIFEMRDDVLCAITVLAPAGGVVREEGTPLEVTWDAANTGFDELGDPRLLDIELWYGQAQRIETIAEEIDPTDEAWMWDAVDDYDYLGQSQSNYKFKIVVRGDPYCYAFSENFTIIPQ